MSTRSATGIGRLLAEVQRIKSEADYDAARSADRDLRGPFRSEAARRSDRARGRAQPPVVHRVRDAALNPGARRLRRDQRRRDVISLRPRGADARILGVRPPRTAVAAVTWDACRRTGRSTRSRVRCSNFAPPAFRIIDLSESNPTRVGLPYPPGILDALADPSGACLRAAPAWFALRARSRGGRVRASRDDGGPEHLLLSASTSEAYSWLFKLLCDPGDAVLVPQPSYPLFEYLGALEGVRTISVPAGLPRPVGDRYPRNGRRAGVDACGTGGVAEQPDRVVSVGARHRRADVASAGPAVGRSSSTRSSPTIRSTSIAPSPTLLHAPACSPSRWVAPRSRSGCRK